MRRLHDCFVTLRWHNRIRGVSSTEQYSSPASLRLIHHSLTRTGPRFRYRLAIESLSLFLFVGSLLLSCYRLTTYLASFFLLLLPFCHHLSVVIANHLLSTILDNFTICTKLNDISLRSGVKTVARNTNAIPPCFFLFSIYERAFILVVTKFEKILVLAVIE